VAAQQWPWQWLYTRVWRALPGLKPEAEPVTMLLRCAHTPTHLDSFVSRRSGHEVLLRVELQSGDAVRVLVELLDNALRANIVDLHAQRRQPAGARWRPQLWGGGGLCAHIPKQRGAGVGRGLLRVSAHTHAPCGSAAPDLDPNLRLLSPSMQAGASVRANPNVPPHPPLASTFSP